jgi:ribosomal protein S18 acetylase RimI-like enzyme
LYVVPEHWSTGAGRRLLDRVLETLIAAGEHRLVLWVLESNVRARRFYERAGFTATRRRADERFGGVTVVSYERDLRDPPHSRTRSAR